MIFETGSAFPERVREVILNQRLNWAEDLGVESLRQRVREHVAGFPFRNRLSELRKKRKKEAYQKFG